MWTVKGVEEKVWTVIDCLTPEEELSSAEFLDAKGPCHTADEAKDDIYAVQQELLGGACDAHIFENDRHLQKCKMVGDVSLRVLLLRQK
jgi:hypothetical protein